MINEEFLVRLRDLLDEYISNTDESDFEDDHEDCFPCEGQEDEKTVIIKKTMSVEEAPEEIKDFINFIRGGK